ncbi:MAG: FAD binding domain-containing protein [Spirochaetia bacterium]|jgi:CO/xanthine dehydrogenase FAD-binding subunit|nr:FAD binding domain-containing protein [Spirochaetia bacterium]
MPTIYEPKNLNSLLNIIKRHPYSIIFSGGLETVLSSSTRIPLLPDNIVYIGKIDELQKMKRSERYLEIGSCTRISHIIDKGKNIIPIILLEALKIITPPNFKNILTIGGLLCSKIERNSIFAVLCILDAALEIKRAGSSRWIYTSQLFNGDKIDIAPDEILTKIRVFLGDYDINIHRKIDNDFSDNGNLITFSAIAKITKENISFLKFIYSTSDQFIIRNKEIETELTGQNLPITEKSHSVLLSHFSDELSKRHLSISQYRRDIIINIFSWFLDELNYY